MHVHEFQAIWRAAAPGLNERAAAQSHFADLCSLLDQPTPQQENPSGDYYRYEKQVTKLDGKPGFADVWWRGKFAWEYKGLGADLHAAYRQLNDYREALENPPLLVVCDLNRFEVHTNFTSSAKFVYRFAVDDLDDTTPRADLRNLTPLDVLRRVFTHPDSLRPGTSVAEVTEAAARRFGDIALRLRERGVDPAVTAHYLVQLLFCLFAEDVGLLPRGLFGRVLASGARNAEAFTRQVAALFEAMRDGGYFGADEISRFNGGLFAVVEVVALEPAEIAVLVEAAALDWSSVEPAIFGTLFERSLDPGKRAQLGAHYTGRADIERVVDPVLLAPLRRRWDAVRAQADAIRVAWLAAASGSTVANNRRRDMAALLGTFQDELRAVTVLDPACGSGNFLYVALVKLLDLEKEVSRYAADNGLPAMPPFVHPRQVRGLEINDYAAELASVVIWIGYLQWLSDNGLLGQRSGAILESLDTIRLQDALLDRTDPEHPKEAEWPAADVIIGNPPFLGGSKVRRELGGEYTEGLFKVYGQRLPNFSDLVCYFFEKARVQISENQSTRAGLLATNSIRGGANRVVLERIKESGDIFLAWDDEPWVIDGAAVRIAIVGFDDGTEIHRNLDGIPVASINSDLTALTDVTVAKSLNENVRIAFKGVEKSGAFDVPAEIAQKWLAMPLNPNGRPNRDVLHPWLNGSDVTQRSRNMWIIDFGPSLSRDDAALYEAPFEHVATFVKPERDRNRRDRRRENWWLHADPYLSLRAALRPLSRYVGTPLVSKHRVFVWVAGDVMPSNLMIAFARDDDYFFGVLHSRAHEVWSLRMGTWLGKGNDPRYTPTTCFETFPFPRPTAEQSAAIAAAARTLDEQRRNWLNPAGADEAELKRRTLTNLYNARPT